MLWNFRLQGLYRFQSTALCLIFMIFALSACSESTRKLSYINQSSPSSQRLSPQESQGPLQDKSAEELTYIGYSYLEKQNPQLAKLHFTTALEKNPYLAEAYLGLGRAEMRDGQFAAALNSFSRAYELDPKLIPALVGQAQALRYEGKLETAIEKIDAARLVAPDDIMVLNEAAIIYDLSGLENLAGPIYQEIIDNSPDVAASYNNLGMNQIVREKYHDAIASFLQALNLAPENTRSKNNLATAYALNGDELKAIKIFTGTVGEAGAYNNLGYLYMTQDRYDKAEEFFTKAIAANPSFYQKAQDNLDQIEQLRNKAEQ